MRKADERSWAGVAVNVPGGSRVRLKVVPGASRSAVVGALGGRLKVAVAAPAEGGRANHAVCAVLADALGVARRGVFVVAGPTQPLKTVEVAGLSAGRVLARLKEIL